ncbi:hypothetical protein CSPX01_05101 [Colletotrichum filicis]|nr:hypothetical protein CSPX01_05101 [Colletotrichum filicis]
MTTTTTDSSSPPEEGDDVIDLVTTDKVGLPDPVPQTVTVPSEPQPPKSRASSIQQLKHIRRPDTQKSTKTACHSKDDSLRLNRSIERLFGRNVTAFK